MQESLPEDPSHKFLEEKYYANLRSVYTAYVSELGRSPFLNAPKSQTSRETEEGTAEMKNVSAMEILLEEFPVDKAVKFEGLLLTINATVRVFVKSFTGGSPLPKKRGSRGFLKEGKGIDLLAVDPTGPVMISLRDADAEMAEDLLEMFLRDHGRGAQQKPIIALQNMHVQSLSHHTWSGTMVTSMKCLTSSRARGKKTSKNVVFVKRPTSPHMLSGQLAMPPASVVLARFNVLERCDAPYRVSLRGTVVEVGVVETSISGTLKRQCKVVDQDGLWLFCVVVGEQALKPGLRENMDVIMFFASGRRCPSVREGAVFLFSNACLWILGKSSAMPRLQRQIVVK